jgi:hypothetical protein
VRDRDDAGQVGREHERTFEDGDEQEITRRIVAGDLGPELADTRRQLLAGKIDLAGAGLYVTRFRPYF